MLVGWDVTKLWPIQLLVVLYQVLLSSGRELWTIMLTVLESVALCFFLDRKLYLNSLFCASVPLFVSIAA